MFKDTGNLNAGSNLSIAIYCYTGITRYEVKDTNPRYSSLNGLIYSKDGKALTAVPARYNAAMEIPEGTERWLREAMWADGGSTVDGLLKDCPGVTLPASLGYIEQEQLAMLNRLHANRAGTANPFTITLDPANTAFYLDETGALCKTCPLRSRRSPGTGTGSTARPPPFPSAPRGRSCGISGITGTRARRNGSSAPTVTRPMIPILSPGSGRAARSIAGSRTGTA